MNHLGLFAKYWEPGQVKTRLAAHVGPQKASDIYFAFLSHLLKQLSACGTMRTIAFSPGARKNEFSELAANCSWGLVPQQGADLGARMTHFFEWAFSNSISPDPPLHRKVVLIGSDTPHIPPHYIADAFVALDKATVVLGPSSDGGYYLVGMNSISPSVFREIDWSTTKVLEQTQERLKEANLCYELLPVLTDVDEVEDLDDLVNFLEIHSSQSNEELLAALNTIMNVAANRGETDE